MDELSIGEKMKIVDLDESFLDFVSLCTHIDAKRADWLLRAAQVRKNWLLDRSKKGLKVKVAIDNGKPVGFIHCLPIELDTWGMSGKDLMTVPCLTLKYKLVYEQKTGTGYGRALMQAAEEETKKAGKKGIAVLCYDHDFWFMPASFFKRLGYEEIQREKDTVIVWKNFGDAQPPELHKSKFVPKKLPDRIAVDIIWNPMCMTSIVERANGSDVCEEYEDKVVLREFDAGDIDFLKKYEISRGLFFNGIFKCWGYEAPKEEVRKVIEDLLAKLS
jgi:GNAT superfamily N-acetyltransferase